jgi:heptosyltransferase III
LPIVSYPSIHEIDRILHQYDWFFVFHNDTSEFIQRLISEGKRRFPDQVKVIYAYPSKGIVHEPYYHDAEIDPGLPIAENLRVFCEKILHLSKSTRSNGLIPPAQLVYRLNNKSVVIHTTSSRAGKNWSPEKYIELSYQLKDKGFEPSLIIGSNERNLWKDCSLKTLEFSSLDAVASFIYESGYFVGNDSGLGHLASFLGIPTVTILRRKTLAKFWAPSFSTGISVAPSSWIPNIRGLRLRDRHWKKLISTQKVLRAFDKVVSSQLQREV